MSMWVVILSYCMAVALAVYLLWRFGHVNWYWHALALATALGLGVMPPDPTLTSLLPDQTYDLAVGSLFLTLLVWGAGEAFFKVLHLPHHA